MISKAVFVAIEDCNGCFANNGTIQGIFSTKSKALRWLKSKGCDTKYHIEEWELDRRNMVGYQSYSGFCQKIDNDDLEMSTMIWEETIRKSKKRSKRTKNEPYLCHNQ